MSGPEIGLLKSVRHAQDIYRKIFAQLSDCDFTVVKLSKVIGMKESGTKRYRRELESRGMLEVIAQTKMGAKVMRLKATPSKIAMLMKDIESGTRASVPLNPRGPKFRSQHMDYPLKRPPTVVVPFRHWMDVALFGPAPRAHA